MEHQTTFGPLDVSADADGAPTKWRRLADVLRTALAQPKASSG
jgi:hypothetical protein